MNVLQIDLIYQEFSSYTLLIDFQEFLLPTGLWCASLQILQPSILMTSFIHYLWSVMEFMTFYSLTFEKSRPELLNVSLEATDFHALWHICRKNAFTYFLKSTKN